ncbi:DUF5686 and carboxypeptidase-like regulatory domain-containing protein [Fulvivirga lutea]|uniref:Carboxypeptidase-like regulatory domain-containing protein n=1 Tax=Fulvivirga lutea TaxID=2810512 RepID=A0A974ZZT9_9BACT|nr:DUF5686 and carboxypeptidase-like regulatory domain-containing protein [Fulvivirga lutea]QSE96654.1 carboxypeptidase-like regulatory domain-containing protein [Fulvivirga lutea]
MRLDRVILLSIFFLITWSASAQRTVVSGRVTDASTGDPIPFANVIFKDQSTGTTTDFEGYYKVEIGLKVDSVLCSYIGYKAKVKPIKYGQTQVVNFQLQEEVATLQEVVFIAGENPAYPILRNVVANKPINDKKSLNAYQYETYSKVEVDVDNITDRFKKKKFVKKITQVMDSVEQIAGEDGKPILPVFISETISQFYFRNNPELKHEKILKSKITGVGVEDGSLVSQFIGSSFQEYNFYQNWLNIVSKDFVSPIADGWKLYYDYDLLDSAMVGNDYCYRLDFYPKREQDLAFYGTMWITKNEYALKQIDATVTKTANLNYIEKIKIQQELTKTEAGAWIPTKNRILLDIGEITENMAGVLAKFYTSNQDIEVNKPFENKFYEKPIVVAEDFSIGNTDEFWESKRHEPLSPTEMSVYRMIDTLKNIPIVKTYTEIINIAVNGYKKFGKFDVGPYLSIYANNTIEGHRFQLGLRTNSDFSNRWIFGGFLAYGTRDDEFKYNGFVKRIMSRDRWTTIQAQYTHDIDQVGLSAEDLIGYSVFLTATKFGNLVRPYYYNQFKLIAQRELFKGYNQKITFNYRTFDPLYSFAYRTEPESMDSPLEREIQTAEVTIESRFAKDELFIQNENDRISLGANKWPIFTVRYTRGIAGIAGSDFSYNRMGVNIQKDLRLGLFGTSNFDISAEHIFETLPYPLLKAHIGNESTFFSQAAFNLMNFSEFASSTYASLRYNHYFEGFVLNRIPVMKKLKWRLVATANVLYGYLDTDNLNLLPEFDENGVEVQQIGRLTDDPYVELGYGVENIFKVLRVDFLHRLTYLDNPDASKFAVKFSFQFIL